MRILVFKTVEKEEISQKQCFCVPQRKLKQLKNKPEAILHGRVKSRVRKFCASTGETVELKSYCKERKNLVCSIEYVISCDIRRGKKNNDMVVSDSELLFKYLKICTASLICTDKHTCKCFLEKYWGKELHSCFLFGFFSAFYKILGTEDLQCHLRKWKAKPGIRLWSGFCRIKWISIYFNNFTT